MSRTHYSKLYPLVLEALYYLRTMSASISSPSASAAPAPITEAPTSASQQPTPPSDAPDQRPLAVTPARPLAIEPPPSEENTPVPPDIQTKPPGDIDMEGEDFHPNAFDDSDETSSDEGDDAKGLSPDEVGRIWAVRPQEVEQKWTELCKYIKDHWWKDPLGEFTNVSKMVKVNEEIHKESEKLFQTYYAENGAVFTKWCEEQNIPSDAMMQELRAATESPEKHNESLGKFQQDMRFPYETLKIHIESLRRTHNAISELPKNNVRAQMESSFVKGVAVFMTILESADITSTSIAPEIVLKELQQVMQRNPDEFKQALAWLDQATVAQRRTWEEAVAKMKNFMKIVNGPVNTTMNNRMKRLITEFKRLDAMIDQQNAEGGCRRYNNLPVFLLTEIHEAWLANEPLKVTETQQNLNVWLRSGNITSDLKKGVLIELVKPVHLNGQLNPSNEGSSSRISVELPDAQERSARASVELPDVQASSARTSAELPDAPENSSRISAGMLGAQARSIEGNPVDIKLERESPVPAKAFSREDAITLILNSRQNRKIPQRGTPDYLRGFTEHGVLVMTRPSVSPLAIYSRFFINAGTQSNPFIIVKTGSEFSPGGAEALQDVKGDHTKFNLRERKSELKSNPITKWGPAVQKLRSEDYKARGKPREPDSYLFVEYADRRKEALSRSELLALSPSAWAKRQMGIYLDEFQAKLKEFEMCKEWGLSPDTMQLLTTEEREQYPWLVKEGGAISAVKEEEEL